jgi:hypothetical protein
MKFALGMVAGALLAWFARGFCEGFAAEWRKERPRSPEVLTDSRKGGKPCTTNSIARL